MHGTIGTGWVEEKLSLPPCVDHTPTHGHTRHPRLDEGARIYEYGLVIDD